MCLEDTTYGFSYMNTVITKAWINKFKSSKGGWTSSQLDAIGLKWPPAKGWVKSVVGNEISQEQANVFEGKSKRRRVIKAKPMNKDIKLVKAPLVPVVERSDSWIAFFDNYPANKRGAIDNPAWQHAMALGLREIDFKLMADDVKQRVALCPKWRDTYAFSITRYMDERYWLTPIRPEPVAANTTFDRLTDRSWAIGLVG